jgi:hypothetical protein
MPADESDRCQLTRYLLADPGLPSHLSRLAELQSGSPLDPCEAYEEVRCHGHAPLQSRPLLIPHSFNLPADVFVEGETRPTRSKKAKEAAKPGDAAANKRSFSSTGLDVGYRQNKIQRSR